MKQIIHKREEALAAHELARTRIANWKQLTFIPFIKGQKVWLDTWNIKTMHYKKLTPKYEGPFEIDKVLGLVTYQLRLPGTWNIHYVFYATLLCLYIENEIYENNYPWPPVELLKGAQVYKVETIIKHWRRGKGY